MHLWRPVGLDATKVGNTYRSGVPQQTTPCPAWRERPFLEGGIPAIDRKPQHAQIPPAARGRAGVVNGQADDRSVAVDHDALAVERGPLVSVRAVAVCLPEPGQSRPGPRPPEPKGTAGRRSRGRTTHRAWVVGGVRRIGGPVVVGRIDAVRSTATPRTGASRPSRGTSSTTTWGTVNAKLSVSRLLTS
jgi:hypothetical protein